MSDIAGQNVWLLVICWNFDETRSIHTDHAMAERELYRQCENVYGAEWPERFDDMIYSIEEYVIQP